MPFNLNNYIKTLYSESLIHEIAQVCGETEESIKKAMQATIPVVLLQLTYKANHTESSYGIYRMVKVAEGSKILPHMAEMLQGKSKYHGILNMTSVALGTIEPELGVLVKKFSGMQEKNIQPFLRAFVPAVLSAVGRRVKKTKMSAEEFSGFMIGQKEAFSQLAPVDSSVSEFMKHLLVSRREKSGSTSKEKKSSKPVKSRFKLGFSLFLLFLISLFLFIKN